jgi:hypothetical protein
MVADGDNFKAILNIHPASQRPLDIVFTGSVPDLAMDTVAVPAILAQRNILAPDILKTAQDFIVFGYPQGLATDLYLYKLFKALKEPFSPLVITQRFSPQWLDKQARIVLKFIDNRRGRPRPCLGFAEILSRIARVLRDKITVIACADSSLDRKCTHSTGDSYSPAVLSTRQR